MTDERRPPPLVLTSPEPLAPRRRGRQGTRGRADDLDHVDDDVARPGARQARGRDGHAWTPPKPFDPVQARAATLAETARLRAARFVGFGVLVPPFHDLSSCAVRLARPPGVPRAADVASCPDCAAYDAAEAEVAAELAHRGALVIAGWSFMAGRIRNPDGAVVHDYPRRPGARRPHAGPEDDRGATARPGGRTGPAVVGDPFDDDPFA